MVLNHNDLFLNAEKCSFEQDYINFLGIRVTRGEVQMEQAKVDKVKDWVPPWNVMEYKDSLDLQDTILQTRISGGNKGAKPLASISDLDKGTVYHWNRS